MNSDAAIPAPPPDKVARDRNLLVLLWGLILAKCFAVEYLVQVYEVPINSALYIWTPTLIFAAVASVVYVTLVREESGQEQPGRKHLFLWSCIAVSVASAIAAGLLGIIGGYLVPAVLSAILGAGFFLLGNISPYPVLFRLSGGGWWLSAALQFMTEDVRNLMIFSLSLLAFAVLPVAILIVRRRKH